MSNSVYKVFEEIEFKAKLLAQYWQNFHIEISQHLPESYQPEIQELSNNLEIALTQLIYELQNPTLTLATTGTTSSGKSTLVNLLCGAEIVPVAEQNLEMTDENISPDSIREVYLRININDGRKIIDQTVRYSLKTDIPSQAKCIIKQLACLKNLSGLQKFNRI